MEARSAAKNFDLESWIVEAFRQGPNNKKGFHSDENATVEAFFIAMREAVAARVFPLCQNLAA